MSDLPAKAPDTQALEQQAQATIESYRAYLDSPAFQHSVDLMVLVKIAGDESVDIRERRRAAEVLAKLRLTAMSALAELTGTREQSLDRLGIRTGAGPSVALTQVNQRVEIVRATDWRGASPLEQGEEVVAEVLPAAAHATSGHATNGHATNGHAKQERSDADDPAA